MAAVRVLIVDDEPAVLDLTARFLSNAGYEVVKASDGERALHLVKTSPPIDLVLSDVMMPGIKGPALVEAVKRDSPSTAVMLMSAFTATSPPPAVRFLMKPFSPEKLIAMVEGALAETARARSALRHALDCSRSIRDESEQLIQQADEAASAAEKNCERLRRQLRASPRPKQK